MLKRKSLTAQNSVSPSPSINEDFTDGSCEENIIESMTTDHLVTSSTSIKDYKITDNGNTNMKVVVRVRPENDMELRSNCETAVKVLDNHVLVFDPKEDNLPQFEKSDNARKRRPFLSKKHKDLRFAFDRVFDETSTQKEVFENTTKTIIDGLLDGINCSVFAYGATGAGKTHTMLGSAENPGVMFLTTMELYKRIEQLKHEKICDVAVTYLEVYNETIRDLLVPSGPLAMREDAQKGLVVAGLSQHQPTSAEDLLQMLENGNKNRTQHPTDANATSSRSHAVFQVYVNQKSRTAGLSTEVTQGKMSLIDLAGSERATVTTNRGARLREGANINKSLLALGNCINALAANKDKTGHVPYRNSKLTRLLKDSLGGNCRTVMIANISPSSLSYDDTYNTLKYADRAKQIKTKLVRNVVNVDYHVTRYRTIVIELQKEITELKSKLTIPAVIKSNRSYFDMSEASRLQCMVSDVYNERTNLRKNMADLDAIERDTLLRIFRKERDLQRIEVFTGNDAKIFKISNKLEFLHNRLKDVKEQKTLVHQQLSTNNEGISRIQSEINTTLSSSDTECYDALSKHMELTTEARKLEAECAHQWKQTKHLLRYIKNQEKEISRTEKVFSLALELVRKQYQLLQATNCITPVVKDLFDTLVRQIEGDKEVIWNDNADPLQDSLCNISVSSFSQTQQTLFDTIVKYSSPHRNGSRYSSPPKSASLGILTCSGIPPASVPAEERSQSVMSAPIPSPVVNRTIVKPHPLSTCRIAPSPSQSPTYCQSPGGSLAGKVLSMPVTSPRRKKRVVFSPSPSADEEYNEENNEGADDKGEVAGHDVTLAKIRERHNMAEKPLPPVRKIAVPINTPAPRTQRSFSTSALVTTVAKKEVPNPPNKPLVTINSSENRNMVSATTTSTRPNGTRIDLAQLTSITNSQINVVETSSSSVAINGFEDNFVNSPTVYTRKPSGALSLQLPITPTNKHGGTPVFPKVFCLTPNGQKLPIPATTPQSPRQKVFYYPQPYSNFSPIGGVGHIKPVPSPRYNLTQCKTSLDYSTDGSPTHKIKSELTKSLPERKNNSLSNPLYISHTVPPPTTPTTSKDQKLSVSKSIYQSDHEDLSDDGSCDKLNSTYIVSKSSTNKDTSTSRLSPSRLSKKESTISSIFKGKDKKTKRPPLVKPLITIDNSNSTNSTTTEQFDNHSYSSLSSVGEKKQPSYLSLTKSAASKRVNLSTANAQSNKAQKENLPARSHSVKNKHKVQLTVNRTANSRSHSVSACS